MSKISRWLVFSLISLLVCNPITSRAEERTLFQFIAGKSQEIHLHIAKKSHITIHNQSTYLILIYVFYKKNTDNYIPFGDHVHFRSNRQITLEKGDYLLHLETNSHLKNIEALCKGEITVKPVLWSLCEHSEMHGASSSDPNGHQAHILRPSE